jgi:uncharacterized protein (TIGR03032 family)
MQHTAPFTCTHSPDIAELLQKLNISIAISTYQTNRVIFLSSKDRDTLVQLNKIFQKPMGIDYQNDKLALALKDELIVFKGSKELAKIYPDKRVKYDRFFTPTIKYQTGELFLHDIHISKGGIYAINTLFSTISFIDGEEGFKNIWKPSFIKELAPEDRCHLNGMAIKNGKPKYVTALGDKNSKGSWRESKLNGGVLIDVDTDEIILKNLPMPHSPRIHKGELYMLLSATGELIKVDTKNRTYEVIKKFKGFVRGLDFYEDFAFVGLSKLRKTSATFGDMPIAKDSIECGVDICYLPNKQIVGSIRYETTVEELYDVKVLPNIQRANILNETTKYEPIFSNDIAFWAMREERNS